MATSTSIVSDGRQLAPNQRGALFEEACTLFWRKAFDMSGLYLERASLTPIDKPRVARSMGFRARELNRTFLIVRSAF